MKPKVIEQNPHNLKTYRDNEQVKAHNADAGVNWAEWEEKEYLKCMGDIKYFARNYVKIINLDTGLVLFDLYPYQEKMYDLVSENRFSIILAPRQSGKTISMVIYLLWYSIFQSDKNVVILANKLDTAVEMLERIQLALENLPFFLQPGCKAVNKRSVKFSNNSNIYAKSAANNSVRGMSIHLLYLDEFSFVAQAEKFYTSTYPTITSGKSTKVIITSTANGVGNVFYRLWSKAVKKQNNYKPFQVFWKDVPGRDDEWKKETIANTSERQFMQEFENKFLGGANTLIDSETLLGIQHVDPVFESKLTKVYQKPIKDHQYVLTADVSEGVGGDSSAFSITDITTNPFEQVAAYKNNKISPYLFSNILVEFGKIYNNAYICIESNDHGSVVNHSVVYDLEYDNIYFGHHSKTEKLGLKTTKKTKRIGCSNIKDLLESGKYLTNDKETIDEICTFEEKGTSYAASSGCHDDLMMTLVLFGYLASTKKFQNEFDINLKETLFSPEAIKQLQESDIPPFGIIDKHDGKESKQIVFSPDKNTNFVVDDLFGVCIEEKSADDDALKFAF